MAGVDTLALAYVATRGRPWPPVVARGPALPSLGVSKPALTSADVHGLTPTSGTALTSVVGPQWTSSHMPHTPSGQMRGVLGTIQAGKHGWAGLGASAAICPIRIADATGSVVCGLVWGLWELDSNSWLCLLVFFLREQITDLDVLYLHL